MTSFDDSNSLALARAVLKERLVDGEAVDCPCCGQLAKVYRRTITSRMAYDLIRLYRDGGDAHGWLHLPTVLGINGGDTAKLAYWGLIEPMPEVEREDGSKRTGWWRVTFNGELFVRGESQVVRYVHVYNGHVQAMTGGFRSIREALGTKFNYDELMRPAPLPGGTMDSTPIAG